MEVEIVVKVDAGKLNFPLRTIWQGELSSAEFRIFGVPADIESLGIVFGVAPTGTTPHDPPTYRAAATKDADGSWRVYCMPAIFPIAGLALEYSIVGMDGQGNPRWLGTGQLNVVPCPASGSADAPDIIPRDTFIRNPATGLYHKLTATVNELGELRLDLAEEGVAR